MKKLKLLLPFLFIGCVEWVTPSGIDPELLPYIESFLVEARERGINNLPPVHVAKFTDELPAGVAGRANYVTGSILISSSHWKISTTTPGLVQDKMYLRENTVFHELGHLLLGRGHEEGSVMCTGDVCHEYILDMYRQGRRDELLDELFFK